MIPGRLLFHQVNLHCAQESESLVGPKWGRAGSSRDFMMSRQAKSLSDGRTFGNIPLGIADIALGRIVQLKDVFLFDKDHRENVTLYGHFGC